MQTSCARTLSDIIVSSTANKFAIKTTFNHYLLRLFLIICVVFVVLLLLLSSASSFWLLFFLMLLFVVVDGEVVHVFVVVIFVVVFCCCCCCCCCFQSNIYSAAHREGFTKSSTLSFHRRPVIIGLLCDLLITKGTAQSRMCVKTQLMSFDVSMVKLWYYISFMPACR